MLDTAEIKKLEQRYEAYARKRRWMILPYLNKNSKILLAELVAIAVLVIVLIFLSIDSPQQKHIVQIPKEQNKTKAAINEVKEKSTQAKIRFEDNKKQDELADKIVQKIEQTLKTTEQNSSESTTKSRAQSRHKQGDQQGWLRLNFINNENSEEIFDEREDIFKNNIPVPKEQIISLDATPAPRQKAKINIEISGTKDEQSMLKEQFVRTNNPTFALDLARINFKEQKYQEAIKWSLAANEIDNNLEESWIIFAKSKYKLKQKTDALKALREYNKNANKSSIGELIRQMESDLL